MTSFVEQYNKVRTLCLLRLYASFFASDELLYTTYEPICMFLVPFIEVF